MGNKLTPLVVSRHRGHLPAPPGAAAPHQGRCEAGTEVRDAAHHLPVHRQHLGRLPGGPERAPEGSGLVPGG